MKLFNLKQLILFSLFFVLTSHQVFSQEKTIELTGIIMDETPMTLPYVAIGISNKNIGTSSNEDGEFNLRISDAELKDTLYVSYLGFNTYKTLVSDFIASENKTITLTENVVSLEDIVLLPAKDYVLNALKNLKLNTLSSIHQTDFLYRRAATEGGRAKFFVENYIKIKDRGPAYWMGRVEVSEIRKSADYRIWKREQWRHSITSMFEVNPLVPNDSQHRRNLKKFNWKKTGDSSYEGEDVVILTGSNPKKKWEKIILYIGLDSYKVYRIERGSSLYIYKKHKSGRLYLSYYHNEWKFPKDQIPQKYWGTPAEHVHYRLEAFAYKVETDKKKIDVTEFGIEKDMGSIDLPYHKDFWSGLSTPPETKFYKKIKTELEGLYGVPIQTQFNISNK
ncbi:carboxypeptidase-like regulatory domain-containing protein [Flavicella sp.]|uniref:carboxypeptidase-like regulatory domain-containing protein n=1 Tax=Flavicella sp. TaxID=2957742 RepID=UPI0026180F50|nr:carboxypeptidase-like regulatory domain-containing protein [Flavicella sp.]MDG1805498.1 carboxypeptidase-like regulatory domain-containing protein [Flavicella sp.]MDG2279487.1 carboxypeptidase-like regulatory domain-containing protein [Flavicella sp.]